jgi:hypothetical protein
MKKNWNIADLEELRMHLPGETLGKYAKKGF